jgi:hypothetical protein
VSFDEAVTVFYDLWPRRFRIPIVPTTRVGL